MTHAVNSEDIGKRFRLAQPPVLQSRTVSGDPITFARLQMPSHNHGRTMPVPREEAFVLQVMLRPLLSLDLWLDGKHRKMPPSAPGDTFLFDLTRNPIADIYSPFDAVRFYISRASLDAMAYERGMRAVGGLRARSSIVAPDRVMHGIATAIGAVLEEHGPAPSLVTDYMALAFHAHVLTTYGGVPDGRSQLQKGLAPWQLRRARDFMNENLGGDPSIAALAEECQISSSYFARAFRQTTGMPPHRWLMHRRVERARELLEGTRLDLADIASICGFADQSHLSRVFSRLQGQSPGQWRRSKVSR